jgi:hypothetical protein
MKLRHATGLALVGWYLLLPQPRMYANTNRVQKLWPLSDWVPAGSFDTAAQCKAEIDSEWRASIKNGTPDGSLLYAVCVARDDPRLAR